MPNASITRRALIGGATAAAALALLPRRAFAQAASPRARALYERAIVMDALGGPGGWAPDVKEADRLLSPLQLKDVAESGLSLVNLTVSDVGNKADVYENTIGNIAWSNGQIAAAPTVFMQVRTAADMAAAKATRRLGIIYGLQDTTCIGTSLDRMQQFEDLGIRIVQPVYNRRNLMGDGCLEPSNGGLSRLGQDLVADLNKRRIAVDMSHAGPRTQADGIRASTRPALITHSGCRALQDNPRNTFDSEMKALADKGGVMGIYFMPFLRAKGQARAADVIAHIEHAWKVMGEDHVGLGTDGPIGPYKDDQKMRDDHAKFTAERVKAGIAAPGEAPDAYLFVPEYNTPRRFETLADDLLKRGHSEARIEKLLGGNFVRAQTEIWG